MYFDKELDFEEAVVNALIECGWESEVIYRPSEKDLIGNWADILFNNNRQKDRLNECPLTDGEMQQIMEQLKLLQSPLKINSFINGRSVSIKRDNSDDKEHFGKEISLKIYDRQEIAYGESRYQIVRQPQFLTKSPILNDRRGDLMLLINGMPVIHIELKKSGVPVSEAYNQIEKYSHEGVYRGIFSLVQVFVAMQPTETVYFANPGEGVKFNKSFYFHWANFNNQPIDKWDEVIKKLLNIPMAHMLIGFYTIADNDENVLKVMRSYQYYAAIGIADKVAKKNWKDTNQLGGHVWHTTGSGKTMTSFKSAQLISSSHDSDKVIFLVDRKELGIQSLKEYRSFANESESIQATENTDILISKLKSNNLDNTLIVTSIQKLSNITEEALLLNEDDLKIIQSKRIVIIIDECHRSTFGEMLTSIKSTFKNSIIFGFTGTPIQEVNIKKDSTTPTIFGDEVHRYTLADGIRDKNVLGFDPYMVKIYDDFTLRQAVALYKAKASTVDEVMGDSKKEKIFYKYMDSSQIKMYGEEIDGKWVSGIEDLVPNEQYQTDEYRNGVITDIKNKWAIYSRGSKFHAIFATSSIPEAVAYYRLLKTEMPNLSITAMFDPNIDNERGGSLDKEDGIVEILEDYNNKYSQSFSIPKYDKFRTDVSRRLAHKKPYDRITQDEQIDILIVVNQILTGFDSKWINTLYLDKVMAYENLIQAFSRTNRLFNVADKPFGIIKYYRRPNTMEKNIEAAVKAYSGDIPTGLFVDKLPNNLQQMNTLFDEIETLFNNANIRNFEKLPAESAEKAKFAKLFKQFSAHLDAATIQGFIWSQGIYYDESGLSIVMHLDEMTYHILLARYKELALGGGGGSGGDVPYDIETHITEYDTEKIDADYMNSKFEKFLKLIQSEYDAKSLENTLKELHKSFSMLSQEEQKYANIFIHDIEAGNLNIITGKSFRDYLSDMMKRAENDRIKIVIKRLGCNEMLLRELLERKVTKETIKAYGKFEELRNSVDNQKARIFFSLKLDDDYQENRLAMYINDYLGEFLLSGGEEPYPDAKSNEELSGKNKKENNSNIEVVLTEESMKGKSLVSSVDSTKIDNWYNNSNALRSVLETDCFAYVENKLCINDNKYIDRGDDGKIRLTNYAITHEEECFLQFVIDDETGELHYITLPASIASKTFNYFDEIDEELLLKYGLVNEMSQEMLNVINGLSFGEALSKLMSKNICNYSVRLLKDTTGLDNRTISNMKNGKNLTKLDVISTCLGIHIPFRVSNRMLQLAEITLNSELPGKKGEENAVYDSILHLKWASDYDDVYDELESQKYEYLIHCPK